MVIVYWSNLLPKIGSLLSKSSKQCINLGTGLVCGALQTCGIEVFTKDAINEALNLKTASDACRDELPIQLTSEHDQVSEIMKSGSKDSISRAKSIMESTGIDKKCIAIFAIVCTKAQDSGALDIIKDACTNLWV